MPIERQQKPFSGNGIHHYDTIEVSIQTSYIITYLILLFIVYQM